MLARIIDTSRRRPARSTRLARPAHPGARRNRADVESGITLTELLVAMMLLAIVLTMASGFFVGGAHAYTESSTIDQNTKTASNVMNEVSRMLRAATTNPVQGQTLDDPAFVTATTSTVTFYAYVNLQSATEQPIKVRFALDAAGNMVETIWDSYALSPGYWGYSAAPSETRTLGGPVQPGDATHPIFGYLDQTGATVPTTGGAVTGDDLRSIAAVAVSFTVGDAAQQSYQVELQNTVGLPNLGLSRSQ